MADLSRLSQLNSSPQTPNPNLTRTNSSPAFSLPEQETPIRGSIPFPKDNISPVDAETSVITAMGLTGSLERDGSGSRARRELSVIEERDAASILVRDEDIDGDALGSASGAQAEGTGDSEDAENAGSGDDSDPATEEISHASQGNPVVPVDGLLENAPESGDRSEPLDGLTTITLDGETVLDTD